MAETARLPRGGLIDRERKLRFLFDGRRYEGRPGDSLASALMANGVLVMGRSARLRRPRGVLSTGWDDPSVRLTVGVGPRLTAGKKATEVELYDGLIAHSYGGGPAVPFNMGAFTGRAAPLMRALPSPLKNLLRRGGAVLERWAAGRPPAPDDSDRDCYERSFAHADVVIIGAGQAGLTAAQEAIAQGLRVIVIEQDSMPGGQLLAQAGAGTASAAWAQSAWEALSAHRAFRGMVRTTVIGQDAQGRLLAVERCTDHLGPQIGSRVPRQCLWTLSAKRICVATGRLALPLLFPGNDLPGVMTCAAVTALVRRWAVVPGRRVVIGTCDDSAYDTALALCNAGAQVVAIVDVRPRTDITAPALEALQRRGVEIFPATLIRQARGWRRIRTVAVSTVEGRQPRQIRCDLLATSGGASPHCAFLASEGWTVQWSEALAAFVPTSSQPLPVVKGDKAVRPQIEFIGSVAGPLPGESPCAALKTLRPWPSAEICHGGIVDFACDVSSAEIVQAIEQGYRTPEALALETGVGAGDDHGRLAWPWVSRLLAITAESNGSGSLVAPAAGAGSASTLSYPVALGVLAADKKGVLAAPYRLSPIHHWHQARGAVWRSVGDWRVPQCFPLTGETPRHALERECQAARTQVSLYDASSLGKFDLQGPQVAAFLGYAFTQTMADMGPGRIRYGIMLRQDGTVLSDAMVTRLRDDHYLITVPPARGVRVFAHLQQLLDQPACAVSSGVFLTDVSEQWATLSLGGPQAREVLGRLAPDVYLGAKAFPLMTCHDAAVAGMPVRIARTSFTGELTFEIAIPARRALSLWYELLDGGALHGLAPIGVGAVEVLRAEKGFILPHREAEDPVIPDDLALDRLVKPAGVGFAGEPFHGHQALAWVRAQAIQGLSAPRRQLVGLLTEDPQVVLPVGAQVTPLRGADPPLVGQGYVTSSVYSPTLGRSIALAMIENGRQRQGEMIHLPLEQGRWVSAKVVMPVFYDPDGKHRDG